MKTNFFVILCFLLFIQSCQKQEASITQLPIHQKVERIFQKDISNAIAYTDSLSKHPEQFDYYFKKSRAEFKKLEMVMAFSNAENYASLNQPNILKIREEDKTDIKILDPLGYQVLEETIYDETIDTVEVLKNASFILNRLKIVKENTQFNHLKNYHFLWMLKKEIARISLTGITGFDSPILENSLQDAQVVYATIKEYLLSIQNEFKDQTLFDQWNSEIDQSIASLSGDFNAFDRYSFIKNHTHKQLELYTKTVKDWDVSFPFALELNDASISLFSDTTFNLEKFASFQTRQITNEKIALGKQLFYDKTLSRDNTTSCATCHQIDKAFTDGLKISKNVTRNSPTLLYTALQRGFFLRQKNWRIGRSSRRCDQQQRRISHQF